MISFPLLDQNGYSAKEAFDSLDSLKKALISYILNGRKGETACHAIPLIFPLAQSVGYILSSGQQFAHSLPDIEKAEELLKKCVSAGQTSVGFFKFLQTPFQSEDLESNSKSVCIFRNVIFLQLV